MADYSYLILADNNPVSQPLGVAGGARDPILREPGNAFRGRFDPGFSYSYPGGPEVGRPAPANPANGQIIYDVAERAPASFVIPAGEAPTWSRGGIDFTGATKPGSILLWPADTLAPIYAAPNDYFGIYFVARMPAQADWMSASGLAPMFCCTGVRGYTAEPDLVTIAQASYPRLEARRQLDGGASVSTVVVNVDAAIFGKVCQVYYVRTAAGQTLAIRPIGGAAKSTTAAAAANNTGDYSGCAPRFGVTEAFNSGGGGVISAANAAAARWKLYDQTIMDLTAGGNPLALDGAGKNLFDRDHDRIVALIAASAEANGGVSQVYN